MTQTSRTTNASGRLLPGTPPTEAITSEFFNLTRGERNAGKGKAYQISCHLSEYSASYFRRYRVQQGLFLHLQLAAWWGGFGLDALILNPGRTFRDFFHIQDVQNASGSTSLPIYERGTPIGYFYGEVKGGRNVVLITRHYLVTRVFSELSHTGWWTTG
jgi:hypothetical protein